MGNMNQLLPVLCIAVLLSFGVLAQFKLEPKKLVAQYDAVAIERIKAEWMQSPLWLKDYHVLLNGILSLQNDNNMLRRNLLNEGEIGVDASFKPRRDRRLAASEESIFDGITNKEREQWIDIMSRIKWASLNVGDRRRLTGDGERTQYAPELIYKPTFTSEAGEFIFPDPSHPEFKQVIIEGTARERGEMPDVIFDSDPSRDRDLAEFRSSCESIQGEKPAELINAASELLKSFGDGWQPLAQQYVDENKVMPIGKFIENKFGDVRIVNALYSVCLNSVPDLDGHFALQSVEVLSDGDIWQPYAVVLYDQEDGSDKFMFDEYTDLSRLHGVKWDDALKGCGVTKDCDIFDGLTPNVKSGESVRVRDVSYPNVKYFREDDRLF